MKLRSNRCKIRLVKGEKKKNETGTEGVIFSMLVRRGGGGGEGDQRGELIAKIHCC